MVKLDIWQDGLKELRQDGLRRAKALIDKYGYPLDEDKIDINDSYEFMFVKSYVDEIDKEYQKMRDEEGYFGGELNFPNDNIVTNIPSIHNISKINYVKEMLKNLGYYGRDMILNVHYPEEKIR